MLWFIVIGSIKKRIKTIKVKLNPSPKHGRELQWTSHTEEGFDCDECSEFFNHEVPNHFSDIQWNFTAFALFEEDASLQLSLHSKLSGWNVYTSCWFGTS